MAWLRIDDLAVLNPKIGELAAEDFRALVALWSYCARRRNDGRFTQTEIKHMGYATPKGVANVDQRHLQTFTKAGLITPLGRRAKEYEVNDWRIYQPKDATAADRMRAYRDRNADRNTTRNGNVTSRARDPVPSYKDGTSTKDAASSPTKKGAAAGAQKAALKEAEQVARQWEGGDSVTFDDKLDAIAREHRTTIPPTLRDRLWDIAFGKAVA